MRNVPITPRHDRQAADFDLSLMDSVALQRLINEVKQSDREGPFDTTLYNRSYHRHNR